MALRAAPCHRANPLILFNFLPHRSRAEVLLRQCKTEMQVQKRSAWWYNATKLQSVVRSTSGKPKVKYKSEVPGAWCNEVAKCGALPPLRLRH